MHEDNKVQQLVSEFYSKCAVCTAIPPDPEKYEDAFQTRRVKHRHIYTKLQLYMTKKMCND